MALDLDDPSEVALAATASLDRAGLEAALYGGLALAIYGEPRETRDADLAVATVTTEAAHAALATSGIRGAIAFSDVRFGGLTIGRISIADGTKLNTIDLVTPRSLRYAKIVMTRVLRGALDGRPLRVVAPEDFILFKVLSTRDKDLEDARSVVATLAERLDVELLRAECDLLAMEIADHDVRQRFATVLR